MFNRTRRIRNNSVFRNMVSNVHLSINDLVYPMFIEEGVDIKTEIPSMPNQFRLSVNMLEKEISEIQKLEIGAVLLFGIPKHKDTLASSAYNDNGVVQLAIKLIKQKFPNIMVVVDVCMCEYTSHGHCGIIEGNEVDNDKTLEYLSKISLSYARAGADMIAPSDCMDGHVLAIRNALDNNNYKNIPIMSYSAKFCSSYYSPFRQAADSAPSFGDRRSYQLDFKSDKEFITKIENDILEGADIVMVKPALAYLDIIKSVSNYCNSPIAAYNVSGEYSMVKAAAQNGWIDEQRVVMENMYAIKRAGADIILTYHAKDICKWLMEKK